MAKTWARRCLFSAFLIVGPAIVQCTPQLWVSPAALSNTVTFGFRAAGQYLYVANTGAPPRSPMAYTVSSDSGWLSVSPTNGSVVDETNTITLTYLTETNVPGWQTGTVTVIATAIATQQVAVVLRVNNTPVLSWDAGQQTWTNSIVEGGTVPSYSFDVWNGSANPTGTLRFTVSSDADWLSFSPAGGTSSGDYQSVTVTYAVSNLPAGVYTGTVTLAGVDDATGSTASNSPLTIVAELTVRGRAVLATDVDTLTNSILENYGSTNAFQIWNGGGAPRGGLSYVISSSVDWLNVNPSGRTVTDDTNSIEVVWSTDDLSPGVYTGTIVVDGTDLLLGGRARGAPKTINVQMNVLSRVPVNLEKPTVYGTPYIGQVMHSRNGLWQNVDRLVFSYQWQRLTNSAGAGMTDIAGETDTNHTIVAADRGAYLRIAVTAYDNNPTPRWATAYSDLLPAAKIRALPGDFNGDGIADLWFFDPLTGMWRASFTANSIAEGAFGSFGMIDVPGDYNGDGQLDLGLYDPAYGMWYIYILPSGPSLSGSLFGGIAEEAEATPVPADYDGDGQTDVALYWRGYWAILYSSLRRIVIVPPIASPGAVPVPGDYDGDRIDDLAVYDAGLWTVRTAYGNQWSTAFGSSAWIPAPGDYDGDAICDLGIYSQASNVWCMIYSSTATTNTTTFGTSLGANIPRQGYYDHDPYCDPATLHYFDNGDFLVWCVTRTTDTNFPYRGQSYQKSIDRWRVSW